MSPGHPDKVADYISESLLDAYIKQDPNARFAVEIQIKDKYVTLGGEVSSNAVVMAETSHFTDVINGIIKVPEIPKHRAMSPRVSASLKLPTRAQAFIR